MAEQPKRRRGRPPGGVGAGGRPATRRLLPPDQRGKSQNYYGTDAEHCRLMEVLAMMREAAKLTPDDYTA